ncbi:hypothetical protein K501DRAFT_199468 [Backusella circina FSU 941]|nr:hypothetical protein K501DRAFT_199468 [Backusella circina FSU 941]
METTLEKALLKKTPCNECRKRKRKCSYEQPCERCEKLNIECSYTVIASPLDLEYMQELEYVKQVEDLEAQICMMEKELNTFKLAQDKNALEIKSNHKENSSEEDKEEEDKSTTTTKNLPITTDYPSPISMDFRSTPSPKITEISLEYNMFGGCPDRQKYVPKYFHNEQHRHVKKNNQLVAKSGNLQVYISPQQQKENKNEKQSWVLTVNKEGGMTINTFITTHAELLHNLQDILHAVDKNTCINQPNPSLVSISDEPYITSAISSFLWKSYGKQRIKNMTKSFQIEYNETMVTRISPIQNLTHVTLQIVHAYMNCIHLTHFFLHIPYFIKHYINPYPLNDILQSPAVMAVCSTLALLPCRHVTAFIPSDAYSDYANYYFDQARELISERFDEMTLETMMTYAFMASYKLKRKKFDEGLKYIDMAKRIYSVLQPVTPEEVVFLQRMNRYIRLVDDTAFAYEMVARGGLFKFGGHRNFIELLKGNDVIPVMSSNQDTAQEKEFILLIQLKSQLQNKLHSVLLNYPISNTLPSCVGEFSHQMEMALRYWYRHDLPDRFQLSLPLFEDTLSDLDFFTTIEQECYDEKISPKILCAINVYNEYLVMARAYVPKNPEQDFPSVDELIKRFHDLDAQNRFNDPLPPPRTSLRWEKFLYRIIHFNRFHRPPGVDLGSKQDEEQHLRLLLSSVQLEDMNFDMPIVQIAIVSALNMVRFIQFLITKAYTCFLDHKWLMNAWDILLRASRFKYEHGGVTLQRIRANMLLCINIMKQHPIYEKVNGFDEVLIKLQEEFDECIT